MICFSMREIRKNNPQFRHTSMNLINRELQSSLMILKPQWWTLLLANP